VSIIFQCAKLHLSNSKCKCSWVLSTNKTLILTLIRPPCSYFSFLVKVILLKLVYPLKIYHSTRFHGHTFIYILHSPQKFERRHFEMVTVMVLKLWPRGHLQWHALLTEFNKNLLIGSNFIRGNTHRQDSDLINLHFSFSKESRLKTKIIARLEGIAVYIGTSYSVNIYLPG
jgi:hypothetical protein